MKFINITKLLVIMLLLNSGCYAHMSATVVDAETGKPVEGAVVAMKWAMTKGVPGLTYGEDYKTVEAVTDKEGRFRIIGVLNPFVNPPTIVVYKKNYVAWNNEYIFPNYERRRDFQWKNSYMFKLEHFKTNYSHAKHISFFSTGFTADLTPKLEQAYSWELLLAEKEWELYREKISEKKNNTHTEEEIWREIVDKLYLKEIKNE